MCHHTRINPSACSYIAEIFPAGITPSHPLYLFLMQCCNQNEIVNVYYPFNLLPCDVSRTDKEVKGSRWVERQSQGLQTSGLELSSIVWDGSNPLHPNLLMLRWETITLDNVYLKQHLTQEINNKKNKSSGFPPSWTQSLDRPSISQK